jgi:hypothetical protein
MDSGYLDHTAQILQLNVKTIGSKCKKLYQGNILKKVEEFKCLLNKESWQQVFQTSEANSAQQVFMDMWLLLHYSIQHSHTN